MLLCCVCFHLSCLAGPPHYLKTLGIKPRVFISTLICLTTVTVCPQAPAPPPPPAAAHAGCGRGCPGRGGLDPAPKPPPPPPTDSQGGVGGEGGGGQNQETATAPQHRTRAVVAAKAALQDNVGGGGMNVDGGGRGGGGRSTCVPVPSLRELQILFCLGARWRSACLGDRHRGKIVNQKLVRSLTLIACRKSCRKSVKGWGAGENDQIQKKPRITSKQREALRNQPPMAAFMTPTRNKRAVEVEAKAAKLDP
jgi:hypothetical protein